MRFITGDECGIIKECIPDLVSFRRAEREKPHNEGNETAQQELCAVQVNGGGENNNRRFVQTRGRGIVGLTWTKTESDTQFASLRMDGVVELWQRSSFGERDDDRQENDDMRLGTKKKTAHGRYRNVAEIRNIFDDDGKGKEKNGENGSNAESDKASVERTIRPSTRPLGISSFSVGDNVRLCACNAAGNVVVLDPTRDGGDPVVRRFSTFQTRATTTTTTASAPADKNDPVVSAAAVDAVRNRVALGGRDRETVLYDLECAREVWKAKNLAPDPRTLLQPLVWPTCIRFLGDDVDGGIGRNVMAVGTAHRQVRIYDVRDDSAQRRPISYTPPEGGFLEHRVTSLCQIDPFHLVAGDAAGYLHAVDLRTLGKPRGKAATSGVSSSAAAGRFVGPAGSVRMLARHGTLPRMAAVGLDRMLRVYDTVKRKQLHAVYLKQRLNCVLVGREGSLADDDDGVDGEDQDIDVDDVVEDYVDSDDEGNDDRVPYNQAFGSNRDGEERSFDEESIDSPSGEEETDDDSSQDEDDDDDDEEEEDDDDSASDDNPPRKRRRED